MVNASNGPHIPSHICHSSLEWLDNTFQNDCIWVVVLDTPELMVPLLEKYRGLSRSGISIEGIDVDGAHPQPGHEHAAESDDIHSSLRGTYGLLCGFAIPLPPRIHFLINFGFTATPRDPWISPACPSGDATPILWAISVWRASSASPSWLPSWSQTSWLVLPGAWMPGPLTVLCLGWVNWGDAWYPLPYPEHAFEGDILSHLPTLWGRM